MVDDDWKRQHKAAHLCSQGKDEVGRDTKFPNNWT